MIDRALVRRLRYHDGMTGAQVAAILGCSPSTAVQYAPGRPGKIDNASLREAFLRSGMTAADVARSIGWLYAHRSSRPLQADGARVRKVLGLEDTVSRTRGRTYRSRRIMIDAETAGLIADAIGVGPWEIGA